MSIFAAKISPRAVPAAHRGILLAAAAGHFNLHGQACRIRACRRIGACGRARLAADDAMPPCIDGLPPEHRATMHRLFDCLVRIYDGTLWPPAARDHAGKALHQPAIAIMRAALARMPERAAHFTNWHSRYCEPPVDTGVVLARMRSELAAAERAQGMDNAGDGQ